MAYSDIITRADAAALVPEQVSNQLLTGLVSNSAALTLFPSVTMSTSQTRMPALAALPYAYFVNGDTGLKQTTQAAWANKYLNVEELAAIVPIPENVLDDNSFDVWGSIRPLLEQAVGRALDDAIFFGTGKPASWPDAIVTEATAKSHVIVRGTATAATGGIAKDISGAFALVEADGYDVNGLIANTTYKGIIRDARDTTGQKLQDVNGEVLNVAPQYPMRGLWPTGASATEAILGDFTQGIIGKRSDFTYKILSEAVITDNTGKIIFNLAQQDMVALRITFRVAWTVANILNYDNPNDATRYPWSIINAPAS